MATSPVLYGIRNCDTMKKARAWLDAHAIAYAFHDYKAAGLERATLERWAADAGWEALLNRPGTTFRKLPQLTRRPVLAAEGGLTIGFKPEIYAALFD
mgnify:CR=1 FL=1